MNDKIQGQIRHLGTIAGPLLMMAGFPEESAMEAANYLQVGLGGLVTFAMMIWSWMSKK